MANFNIVVDTGNFKPFDISPALAILNKYSTQYEKNQAVYDKMALVLSNLKSAALSDPSLADTYNKYADALNTASNDFYKGMNLSTARELGRLRNIYNSDILPMENARLQMLKLVNARLALSLLKPEMMFEDIGKLSDYMNNPNYTPRSYDGTLLSAQAAEAGKAIAKKILEARRLGKIDEFLNEYFTSRGATPEQIDTIIRAANNGLLDLIQNNIYKDILDNVVKSSLIPNWNGYDDNMLNLAYLKAARGLWSAVGADDTKVLLNMDSIFNRKALIAALSKKKSEEEDNTLALRHYNYLENDGLKATMLSTADAITLSNGAPRASYFGKDKWVNPMKVYEELENAYRALLVNKEGPTKGTLSLLGTMSLNINDIRKNNNLVDGELKLAKLNILNKYGITLILSDDLYDALKELGYDANSTRDDFRYHLKERINDMVTSYNHASINLANLDIIGTSVISNIFLAGRNDTLKNVLWLVEANGKEGEPVTDIDDIEGWHDKEDELHKNAVNDVYYSFLNPTKVRLVINNHSYYANPGIISLEAANIVSKYSSIYKKGNDEVLKWAKDLLKAANPTYTQNPEISNLINSITITLAKTMLLRLVVTELTLIFRGFNKQRGNTDSNI